MARDSACPLSVWRNTVLGVGLCALLSGCANAPTWAPWYKPPPAPVTEPAVPPAEMKPVHTHPRHVRRRVTPPEPAPQIAMIEPNTLVGKKRSAVTRLLGAPARITKEEMSYVWIYEADGCALKVYFYPDLKTSTFHVLKFSLADPQGKPLDSDASCRRKLLAVRDHDTG